MQVHTGIIAVDYIKCQDILNFKSLEYAFSNSFLINSFLKIYLTFFYPCLSQNPYLFFPLLGLYNKLFHMFNSLITCSTLLNMILINMNKINLSIPTLCFSNNNSKIKFLVCPYSVFFPRKFNLEMWNNIEVTCLCFTPLQRVLGRPLKLV